MASGKKKIQQQARQFFSMSLVNGALSPERVSGVLEYIEKHRPSGSLAILKAYSRLVSAEVARGRAVVEHAGPVEDTVLARIASSMTAKYGRPVTSLGRRNDTLLAGLRVRVGDDVYESSVAGQLATLASSV
jgi:F-type H+-transporting ATPase subunit delta